MATSMADDEGAGRPLSVKEISVRAQDFEWRPNIPFKYWLRTTQILQQEADMYLRDGNFSQAYLLYLRCSTLVIDLLKTHPEYKRPENKKALQNKFLTIDVIFRNLEQIKPLLEQYYEEWKAAQSRKKALSDHFPQRSTDKLDASSRYKQHASKDPALSYATRLLDAGENQDLAVELAQREIQRRDTSRRATRGDDEANRGHQDRRTAGYWDTLTQDIANKQADDEALFRYQMESTRRTLDGDANQFPGHSSNAPDLPPKPIHTPHYSYPKITKSTPIEYSPQHHKSNGLRETGPLPLRPPKERTSDVSVLLPERPAKTPYFTEPLVHPSPETRDAVEAPARPPKLQETPTDQPSTKQQRVAFKPAAYLENGDAIRPIFLPRQLRPRFLEIASENTKRGVEMCGILCGTAVNNALFVRCLLIPEQKCTSDTCETENEEAMLEYCIEEDLLVLGWIHTHPTQTCFMSSRDLHTQSGYQVMLPESVAIVCAPKYEPSYGIFRLTNPPGLSHILNCTQSSTFHPHSVDNLYTGAENPPGHVYEHGNLEFYVQDIRPGAQNSAGLNKRF